MRAIIRTVTNKLEPGRNLLRDANSARDIKDYARAAKLYGEYLALNPKNARIHIQAGHMFKELGIFAEAGRHYQEAATLLPDDADLHVQIGHFYKVTDRLDDAVTSYQKAVELSPDSLDARHQLEAALHMQKAPDRTHASPRLTMLARVRLNSGADEFLRNVPAAGFDKALADIAESGRHYLLEGIEQRFPDPALPEESTANCIALCLEAEAPEVALRIVESALKANPQAKVALSLLRTCLDKRTAGSAALMAPLSVQLTTVNVATNLLTRQRALLDRLAPMP